MAKIYPEHLPESITNDPKRKAEIIVYDTLAAMDARFVVFYSVSWQARKDGTAQDGEADFVVMHPDYGVLILEVKGGRIEYEASNEKWFTIDRNDNRFEIKDPVEQAKRSHHTLFDKLCDLP